MMRNFLFLSLLNFAFAAQAQYVETFSTPNKGYKLDLMDDFAGVNWTISAWNQAAGERDATDYFNTTATGVLEAIDLDQEVCWESPVLNTLAAPVVSLKMDLTWAGFDSDVMANNCLTDYIRVFYRVNSGAYVMIPNIAGGNACATVSYPFENPGQTYNGSMSINQTGIVGDSTLKIRVCVFTNANAEVVTIDNVGVTEAGVILSNKGPLASTISEPKVYPNPSNGAAMISFQLLARQVVMLSIFDCSGRKISSQEALGLEGVNQIPLHLEGLTQGVYWIDLQSENGKTQQRLVLQR
jgi:hypothetical protein